VFPHQVMNFATAV